MTLGLVRHHRRARAVPPFSGLTLGYAVLTCTCHSSLTSQMVVAVGGLCRPGLTMGFVASASGVASVHPDSASLIGRLTVL